MEMNQSIIPEKWNFLSLSNYKTPKSVTFRKATAIALKMTSHGKQSLAWVSKNCRCFWDTNARDCQSPEEQNYLLQTKQQRHQEWLPNIWQLHCMAIAIQSPFWNMISRAFATVLKTPKQHNHAADGSEKNRWDSWVVWRRKTYITWLRSSFNDIPFPG
jgi:hypothetical protein